MFAFLRHLPKNPKVFQQAELCRWLLKTDIRMHACFSMDMHDKGALNEHRITPMPGAAPSVSGGGAGGGQGCTSPLHVVYDEGVAEEITARKICGFGYKVLENTPEPPPPGRGARSLPPMFCPSFSCSKTPPKGERMA